MAPPATTSTRSGNDPIIGNDVFIGGGGSDSMDGEGGDDIMVGSGGQGDRYIGVSGFDWATFKDDHVRRRPST